MNFNRKPTRQPELALDSQCRPTTIETRTHEEYLEVVDRERRGEFNVDQLERGSGFLSDGYLAGAGSWVFRIRWPKVKL